MFVNGVQFAGDSFPANKITVLNKTGGTMVTGGTYALDIASVAATDPRTRTYYAVATAAGNLPGILLVPEKDIAAGDTGLVVIQGPSKALCDGSGVAIAAGDPLKAAAASNKLVKATIGTDRVCAFAQEATVAAAGLIGVFYRGFFPHI